MKGNVYSGFSLPERYGWLLLTAPAPAATLGAVAHAPENRSPEQYLNKTKHNIETFQDQLHTQ